MTKHPYHGLSKHAIEIFERIATGQKPHGYYRTMKALVGAGLIMEVGVMTIGRDAFGAIEEPIYDIPIPVHYQWCRWCDENVSEADIYHPPTL